MYTYRVRKATFISRWLRELKNLNIRMDNHIDGDYVEVQVEDIWLSMDNQDIVKLSDDVSCLFSPEEGGYHKMRVETAY
jgi:hypothetical protein